jgi:hypothetical protein|tara:strand:- start:380 stop:541 length:162 start_codon:yes stop_codon:yes gene_type:complete
MSEPNYYLVGFMCIVIIVCYTLGFIMGIKFEKEREKEKQEALAEARANKKGRR